MTNRKPFRAPLSALPLLIAIIVLIVNAGLLSGWIVDDAGITFAYARNLAAGHGLVSQPGQQAVEGFSNPLWTIVVALLYAIGVFDLTIAPKVLGIALASGVLVMVWQDLRYRVQSVGAATLPLVLVASCSPFVIWTTSGLENALLAFLVILSARLSLEDLGADGSRPSRDVIAGAVAALAALTRPDALVYAAMYPFASLLGEARHGWPPLTRVCQRWLSFGAGLIPVYGGYLLFRIRYFGDIVPNTFYAKPKPSVDAVSVGKLADLVESATGDFFPLVVLFLAGCLIALALRRHLAARTVVLSAFLAAASAVFLVMPSDWMGEYRFATAFYPLLFWTLTEVAVSSGSPATPVWVTRAFQITAVVFTLQVMTIFSARTLAFAQQPTVPLREVQAYAGDGFNRLAQALGAEEMSMLTPDLGGALLDSTMRVYDLAGLCDRRIAHALSANDTRDIQEYVFGEIKPTFIHMHGAFIRATRLNEDPRLERDYVAIYEHRDGPAEWNRLWNGTAMPAWAGDYVRRDVLGPNGERRQLLDAAYRSHRLDRFVPWVRPSDRLQQGWPQLFWAAGTLRSMAEDATRPALDRRLRGER